MELALRHILAPRDLSWLPDSWNTGGPV